MSLSLFLSVYNVGSFRFGGDGDTTTLTTIKQQLTIIKVTGVG
jgi:hypothetical protein